MWSLPDINSLNARAAANVQTLKREAKRKRKPNCEVYGCDCRAVESVEWFDIFSDDPKGLIHVCGEHPADAVEGFFSCEDCQRVVVDHYTWERYQTEVDGASLCLKCAAKRYFAENGNWLSPRQVKSVVLEPHDSVLFDPQTGVLNVAHCRHVLGVSQPLPKGIKFLDNAEFDNLDGHQISGRRLLEIIQELNEPFCLVLDAAYQFAVSIGIYVRRSADELKEVA
jgi:hypothetical protein